MASIPSILTPRQNDGTLNPLNALPKFMPPVTLNSLQPHPYLPFQPHKSQFIIQPKPSETVLSHTRSSTTQIPKNILAASKAGDLEWVKRYSEAGETDLADSMGEVLLFNTNSLEWN
jgi:hypothetical protein